MKNPLHVEWDIVIEASLKIPNQDSAVLVPLSMQHGEVHILLTKRSEHLRTYPGHWVFPGGRVDDTDGCITTTALRESQEEIGLSPQDVNILGLFNDINLGQTKTMTPVIGLIPHDTKLTPNPDEVSQIIQLPLKYLYSHRNGDTCILKDIELREKTAQIALKLYNKLQF